MKPWSIAMFSNFSKKPDLTVLCLSDACPTPSPPLIHLSDAKQMLPLEVTTRRYLVVLSFFAIRIGDGWGPVTSRLLNENLGAVNNAMHMVQALCHKAM